MFGCSTPFFHKSQLESNINKLSFVLILITFKTSSRIQSSVCFVKIFPFCISILCGIIFCSRRGCDIFVLSLFQMKLLYGNIITNDIESAYPFNMCGHCSSDKLVGALCSATCQESCRTRLQIIV